MILYNKHSIFTNNSEIHLRKPEMFFEKNEIIATYTSRNNENCPVHIRKMIFIHHPIHKLQLNGFGITHLKWKCFDNNDSIS